MIDRALESNSVQYKLTMRILLFFLSSVDQLKAELFTELDIFTPYFFPSTLDLLCPIHMKLR